jgi:hypothetical protein
MSGFAGSAPSIVATGEPPNTTAIRGGGFRCCASTLGAPARVPSTTATATTTALSRIRRITNAITTRSRRRRIACSRMSSPPLPRSRSVDCRWPGPTPHVKRCPPLTSQRTRPPDTKNSMPRQSLRLPPNAGDNLLVWSVAEYQSGSSRC